MNLTIKKTFTSTVDVVIETPSFWRSETRSFKIVDENRTVEVYKPLTTGHDSIGIVDTTDALRYENLIEITEAMYNEVYEQTIDKINSL